MPDGRNLPTQGKKRRPENPTKQIDIFLETVFRRIFEVERKDEGKGSRLLPNFGQERNPD